MTARAATCPTSRRPCAPANRTDIFNGVWCACERDRPSLLWQSGDRIHGFANGVFGYDSYTCRTVETVGRDWIVTRNDSGVTEFAALADVVTHIADPEDRWYCGPDCEEPAELYERRIGLVAE